jgi:hypothetical protein
MVEISLQLDEYSKSYAGKQVSFFPHFFVVQQIGQVFLAFTHILYRHCVFQITFI